MYPRKKVFFVVLRLPKFEEKFSNATTTTTGEKIFWEKIPKYSSQTKRLADSISIHL